MAISTRELRIAAGRFSQTGSIKTLAEAVAKSKQTAFLCHSHIDEDLARGLQILLAEDGWDLYIDWQDTDMPDKPNEQTARKIKNKISETQWFLFLATPNSMSSKWCPWEIGVADSSKQNDKILIIPTVDDYGRWYGNEYLSLYRKIDTGSSRFKASGYAVFEPGSSSGKWVNSL